MRPFVLQLTSPTFLIFILYIPNLQSLSRIPKSNRAQNKEFRLEPGAITLKNFPWVTHIIREPGAFVPQPRAIQR